MNISVSLTLTEMQNIPQSERLTLLANTRGFNYKTNSHNHWQTFLSISNIGIERNQIVKKLTVLMSNDASSFLMGTVELNLSKFDDVPRPHLEK